MTDTLDLTTAYRAILEAARNRRFISYGDLAKANGADWQKVRYQMNRHLGELVRLAVERGWPMPSAIVVNQANLTSGALDGTAREGFLAAARESGITADDPEAFVREQQQAEFYCRGPIPALSNQAETYTVWVRKSKTIWDSTVW